LLDCIAQRLQAALPVATLVSALILEQPRCFGCRQVNTSERGILVRGQLVLGARTFMWSEKSMILCDAMHCSGLAESLALVVPDRRQAEAAGTAQGLWRCSQHCPPAACPMWCNSAFKAGTAPITGPRYRGWYEQR
jgi:hypothetical protein